jgi:hypothetical protein
MTNEWDFKEVARRRRAMEDDLTAREDGEGVGKPSKIVVLYCDWSLIAYTGIKYKNNTCVGISNIMILHSKLN